MGKGEITVSSPEEKQEQLEAHLDHPALQGLNDEQKKIVLTQFDQSGGEVNNDAIAAAGAVGVKRGQLANIFACLNGGDDDDDDDSSSVDFDGGDDDETVQPAQTGGNLLNVGDTVDPDKIDFKLEDLEGQYTTERELGHGAFGVVSLGRVTDSHPRLQAGLRVAIKQQ